MPQLGKKSPTFFGIQNFTLLFTRASRLSHVLGHMTELHFMSYIYMLLLLSSHLCLGLASGLFPSSFLIWTVHKVLASPIYATFPVSLILLNFITLKIFDEQNTVWSLSLHYFIQSLLPHPSEVKMSSSMYVRPLKPHFTPIQNKKQRYISVYIIVHIYSTLHFSFTHFFILPKCHARGRW